MYSTAHKISTLRTAVARSVLEGNAELVQVLRSRKGPKGDALEMARAAGVLAGKRTWELIPYCHPLQIDQITVDYEFTETTVEVTATATTIGKTGIEMEAIVAAQLAATTLFDMCKPLDIPMRITGTELVEKRGGKSSFQERIPEDFRAAVVVTSDGTAAGTREDKSGKIIRDYLQDSLNIDTPAYVIIPDEQATITDTLRRLIDEQFPLIVTTGGTGLGPRDVTVEATANIIEREIPGVMETARAYGQRRTPYAMLSRGLAGVVGKTIIVNLPGSSRGTQESLHAIFPALLHSYGMIAGGGH